MIEQIVHKINWSTNIISQDEMENRSRRSKAINENISFASISSRSRVTSRVPSELKYRKNIIDLVSRSFFFDYISFIQQVLLSNEINFEPWSIKSNYTRIFYSISPKIISWSFTILNLPSFSRKPLWITWKFHLKRTQITNNILE